VNSIEKPKFPQIFDLLISIIGNQDHLSEASKYIDSIINILNQNFKPNIIYSKSMHLNEKKNILRRLPNIYNKFDEDIKKKMEEFSNSRREIISRSILVNILLEALNQFGYKDAQFYSDEHPCTVFLPEKKQAIFLLDIGKDTLYNDTTPNFYTSIMINHCINQGYSVSILNKFNYLEVLLSKNFDNLAQHLKNENIVPLTTNYDLKGFERLSSSLKERQKPIKGEREDLEVEEGEDLANLKSN